MNGSIRATQTDIRLLDPDFVMQTLSARFPCASSAEGSARTRERDLHEQSADRERVLPAQGAGSVDRRATESGKCCSATRTGRSPTHGRGGRSEMLTTGPSEHLRSGSCYTIKFIN